MCIGFTRAGSGSSRTVAGILMILMMSAPALAGTVINMPPAKSRQLQQPTQAAPAQTQAASSPVTVGDVALYRYAKARGGTYDTYQVGTRYAGIRQYGYPSWTWGGFPWFWGGFSCGGGHAHNASVICK